MWVCGCVCGWVCGCVGVGRRVGGVCGFDCLSPVYIHTHIRRILPFSHRLTLSHTHTHTHTYTHTHTHTQPHNLIHILSALSRYTYTTKGAFPTPAFLKGCVHVCMYVYTLPTLHPHELSNLVTSFDRSLNRPLNPSLLLSTHIQQVTAGVMGIDLGSEFMKVSLVKPGSMMDIVTNIHSKRKTETMVSFYQVCVCVCMMCGGGWGALSCMCVCI